MCLLMRFCAIIVIIFPIISTIFCQNVVFLDKDNYRTSPELIESRGFQSESHTVVTEDGYILTLFRILNPNISAEALNQNKPLLLWHGLSSSSDSWLISRPGKLNSNGVYSEDNNLVINNCNNSLASTLAYSLAACGYDVWLGNTRGNQYSNKHKTLNNLSPEYNDYTLTELGIYDKPATIDYIMNLTKQDSVSFIGHSLGTTAMFILLSLEPSYEKYINPFIALAPVAFMGNIKSNLAQIAPFEPLIRGLELPFGMTPGMAELLGAGICGTIEITDLCIEFLFQTYGSDWLNTDRSRFPIYMSNSYDPISTRVFAHYAQIINSKGFQQFNYPTLYENFQKYGRLTPPDYPISAIKSRNMALIQGLNDYLADIKDINIFTHSLKVPLLMNYTIPYKSWNHLDFQWAIHANTYLNPIIFKILNDANQ